MKSYKDLDTYKLAFYLAIKVHSMSIKLPKYELYEQGSQIRRSSKSVKDNIVEGYGRRKYKADFIKFLVYAHASLLECISQLQMIKEIHQINEVTTLLSDYEQLGGKLYNFIKYVEKDWKTTKN